MLRKMMRNMVRRNAAEKEPERPSWTFEEAEEAIAFRHLLVSLEKTLHNSENQTEIVETALRSACIYYDADWAGILLVDLSISTWAPAIWYNRETDGMTTTAFNDVEFTDGLPRWTNALQSDEAIVLPSVEKIRSTDPQEYALYQRLKVKSVIGVPYWKSPTGFLVVRNPNKHKTDSDLLRMLAFVSLAMFQIQEIQSGVELMMKIDDTDNDNLVRIDLLGTPQITTSRGSVSQGAYKSQKGWRILIYLLLHYPSAIPAKEIAADIWPREDNEVAADSIRGIIYRFKQRINFLGIDDLIISTPNGYRLNPDYHIITDKDRLETLSKYCDFRTELDLKAENLKHAIDLYHGDLFADAADEDWLIGNASHYHLLYLKIAVSLYETMDALQDYCGIHDYALKVLEIDRGNVDTQYWLILAMKKLGAVEQAKRAFQSAKDVMTEEDYEDLRKRLTLAFRAAHIDDIV